MEHKTNHATPRDRKNKKWATFTYIFPQIRKVTNTFSITNIKQPEFDTCEVYIETVILTFDSKKVLRRRIFS